MINVKQCLEAMLKNSKTTDAAVSDLKSGMLENRTKILLNQKNSQGEINHLIQESGTHKILANRTKAKADELSKDMVVFKHEVSIEVEKLKQELARSG